MQVRQAGHDIVNAERDEEGDHAAESEFGRTVSQQRALSCSIQPYTDGDPWAETSFILLSRR